MAQVGRTAHAFEAFEAVEFVGDGYLVDSVAALIRTNARLVDRGVRIVVEVFAFQKRDNLQYGVRVNEKRAKNRLLRLDVVGQ